MSDPLDKAGGYSGAIMILLGCLLGSAHSVPATYSVSVAEHGPEQAGLSHLL